MARCGNCKATDQTVAHIRACYQHRYNGTMLTLLPGDSHNRRDEGGYVHRVNGRYEALCTMQFVYDTTVDTALPVDCPFCLAKLGRPKADYVQPEAAKSQEVSPWAAVNELRNQVQHYLAPKPSGDRVGYFAINVVDGFGGAPVKFYRIKAKGNRVYVDAQASDEYHALRSPQSLEMVLKAILKDPKLAAERYADELGRCYRCGRTLTDETSRSVGMGPECRSK